LSGLPRVGTVTARVRPNRNAVYTYVFGDYDSLKTPTQLTRGWDYICFTDDPELRSDVWDVRLSVGDAADHALDRKRYAVKHMTLAHRYVPRYDATLAVGGQFRIACDLDAFLARHFADEADDMMICRSPSRDCIYDEGEACKRYEKDDPAVIDAHVARYRAEGYPRNRGLYSTRFIARRGGRPAVEAMCELWFEEVLRGSRRDQMSLNYALWKSAPIRVAELDPDAPDVVAAFLMHHHKHQPGGPQLVVR
jgi:hypothetical protein